MAYLTERTFSSNLDVPVNLPTMELKMGDWLVVATIKIVAPMQFTYRMMNLNFVSSTVPLTNIASVNRIVPNFGLCYVGLFFNYNSSDPALLPTLDVIQATNLGVTQRTATPVVATAEGTYSWIAVNNVKFSDQNSLLGAGDSADFTLGCVGQARIQIAI